MPAPIPRDAALDAPTLRKAFTDFFVERGHAAVAPAGLVPADPSVLFTIAGMVQFKDYFTGTARPPYPRATTIQPCVRTVDIDVIGTTTRHLTLFEMLGHFSFGDYFKTEAIGWAWDFYTEVLGIAPDDLWVTVHESDDEAEKIWIEVVGFPSARIQRMGEDNFWKMGETGPCGPCSELYFDRGESFGPGGGPAVGGAERYVEIGNLVFMQFDRASPGADLVPLDRPSIDFGGGLERVLPILQGHSSVFDTDVLRPIVEAAEEATGTAMGTGADAAERGDAALRVMADHARASTFIVADHVVPSNEGRGYVLRRLIRRLVLKAYQLGVEGAVAGKLVDKVIDTMGGAYPVLVRDAAAIRTSIVREEEHFLATLRSGMAILAEHLESARPGDALDGDIAFLLHDTHGFPVDLTTEIAGDRGVSVDTESFEAAMGAQRERARSASRHARLSGAGTEAYRAMADAFGPTDFVGYTSTSGESEILSVLEPEHRPEADRAGEPLPAGRLVEVFLRTTPFYAEGGGQVGDRGTISTSTGLAEVVDTTYAVPGIIRHLAVVSQGELEPEQIASLEVDVARRNALRRNHTGTHLLHWALRRVLGDHVHQQGSLVAPDRLRFDFSHFEGVHADELSRIEELVNDSVLADDAVRTFETSKEHASELGAMAFFGDKYGDVVRVVEAGDSIELCGGTHVGALGMIGPFKVVSEGSVGSGIRRIEALTGTVSAEHIRSIEERLARASRALKVAPEEVPDAVERLLARLKSADEEIRAMRSARLANLAAALGEMQSGGSVVARRDGLSAEELRELATLVRQGAGVEAVVLAGSPDGSRVALVGATAKGSALVASELIAEAARIVGGGAGRGDDMAVAGGRDVTKIDQALEEARRRLGAR